MRVHIGTDHAGFDLKRYLIDALTEDGHEIVDHGPHEYDAEDDYPVYLHPRGRGGRGRSGIALHRDRWFRQR